MQNRRHNRSNFPLFDKAVEPEIELAVWSFKPDEVEAYAQQVVDAYIKAHQVQDMDLESFEFKKNE